MSKDGEGSAPVKKAPRKKASTTNTARTKTVAAKKAVRKAPTKTTASKTGSSSSSKMFFVLFMSAIVVGGISLAIGKSDEGQIDVTATIAQRASMQEAQGDFEGSVTTRAVSSGSEKSPLNDGLVGSGNKNTRQQELESKVKGVASSTASSTDETASSTESMSGEDAEFEEEASEENVVSEETGNENADIPAPEEEANIE
ncbi:hypothetical protein N8083_01030 [Candidatus Pacebacteria bacterium]|nr:hypothetical protein [Candidatus Paceibacterota bacterium]